MSILITAFASIGIGASMNDMGRRANSMIRNDSAIPANDGVHFLLGMNLKIDYVLHKWQPLKEYARIIPIANRIYCPNNMTHPQPERENRVS